MGKKGAGKSQDHWTTGPSRSLGSVSSRAHPRTSRDETVLLPTLVWATDYGRAERKQPSLHGRKFNPNPKFLAMAAAYFVCHIGPIFQISQIYTFIGCPQSVSKQLNVRLKMKKIFEKKECYGRTGFRTFNLSIRNRRRCPQTTRYR